jgi:cytochrome c5
MISAWLGVAFASAGAGAFAAGPSLPEGPAKSIITTACVSCHGLDVVTDKKRGKQDWENSVSAMIDRGLSLSKDQALSVVDYLAQNFGGPDRGRGLVIDICSGCHEVTRIREHELTRDQWWEVIKNMLSEGAAVTDDETDLILNYLSKNFGKKVDK